MTWASRRHKIYLTLQSWASIAPLMACILGPLSILLGIPALSQRWRGYVVGNEVIYTLPDPALNIILASMSLACEVFANALLMLRFSSIAVYITTAASLALWIAKVAICLGNYVQFIIVHPQPSNLSENWIYLEGFWIGCASMVISTIVIVFLILNLTISPMNRDLGIHEKAVQEQHRLAHRGFMIRVLVLVVSMGLGSLAFSKLEDFSFVTALYFVTASILTVGFGDIALTATASKIILFPYLVFSITYVALMVSSIAGLIDERLYAQKQLREHLQQVTQVAEKQMSLEPKNPADDITERVRRDKSESDSSSPDFSDSGAGELGNASVSEKHGNAYALHAVPLHRTMTLQEEIEVQAGTIARVEHRRQIRNIFLALFFFAIFWFIGAIAFSYSEGWAYGEALYFCYVFFMTVGYGDYSAKSQLGRCLFIVYAMIAVPTVTFLVQVFVEAADVKKYIYNSKRSRQNRINELDTRDFHEIKRRMTQENGDGLPIGLRRTKSISQAGVAMSSRTRTLSRSATMDDRSLILTQTIRLEAPQAQSSDHKRARSIAPSEHTTVPEIDVSNESSGDDSDNGSAMIDEAVDEEELSLASRVLDIEIKTRARLIQNARKLDHLTRLLISPHLHHEARLLLSLEMGRLDNHYKQMLHGLSKSQSHAVVATHEQMENTREAEWLGLTGIERERKFVLEYRECFVGLLNDVETLVSDVTPILELPAHKTPTTKNNEVVGDDEEAQFRVRSDGKLEGTASNGIRWAK